MKAVKLFVVACLVTVLGSCVVVPVDDSSPRPHAPPPPSVDRPIVRISDLDAVPAKFLPGKSIDFVVKIENSGGRGYGFDIGVFHEARLVGWINEKEIPRGVSNFRLKDDKFTGDSGSYIVKVRERGKIVDERRFSAWPAGDGRFTIDPGQAPRDRAPDRRVPDGRHSTDVNRYSPPWDDSFVSIVNLEASPAFFMPKKPIDFVVKIQNRGSVGASGFDVGIFHEGRLVAWEMSKGLNPGANVFKLQDNAFTGDPGSYIVKVRRGGRIIDEKAFATYRKGFTALYTLDPSKVQREERRPYR